jgi:hypothetical protein
MMKLLRVLILALYLLWAAPTRAAIDQPARGPDDFFFSTISSIQTARVNTARVVMADYDLIARDFPKMAQLAGESLEHWHSRVDQWIVSQTGFIAIEQASQTLVNSPISTTGKKKPAFRPKRYGRGMLMPVEGGMIDMKGTGAIKPAFGDHKNGLATLGESIREFLYEKLVAAVLDHSNMPARTVGTYAVLDYGFDVIHDDGKQSRAGAILRQAHRRAWNSNSGLDSDDALKVELTLRKYGITSTGEMHGFRAKFPGDSAYKVDALNIQGTSSLKPLEIIDFGAYLAVDRFEFPIATSSGMYPLLQPNSPQFVQPNPALRVPLEQWGTFDLKDPKSDKPWVWSHELAQAWAEGRADHRAVDQHFRNFLEPFLRKLGPGSCVQYLLKRSYSP